MDILTVENQDIQPTNREVILDFEEKLSQVEGATFGDTDKCPLTHKFADGMYVREIFIPKGMMIVGKIHKHSHPNFLLSGEVSVFTEQDGIKKLKGPLSMISSAGTKRVVYAHEDSVWITVHLNLTDTQDLKEIEEETIAKSFDELDGFLGIQEIKQLRE